MKDVFLRISIVFTGLLTLACPLIAQPTENVAVALNFNHQVVYYPKVRPGYTAFVKLFLFGNGDMGLSFTEIRRAHNPRFVPLSLEQLEARGRPYSFGSHYSAAQPNVLSEGVYMKSGDGGLTWEETGRSWGKAAYLTGYPDGRMVRLIWNQQVEHYETGLDRLYTPVEESIDGGQTWKQIARVLHGCGVAPFRVKKLRDGSLVASALVWPAMGPGTNRIANHQKFPNEDSSGRTFFMYSPDGGYTWTGPHSVLQGIAAPEADFVELHDGRLLFVNSNVQHGAQARQFVHRVATGFIPDPVIQIQGPSVDPYDNSQPAEVPETIDITPDGLIVGTRRGGRYTCSNDLGKTWHVISGTEKGFYQPQLVCLPDGRFMSAGHMGTDSALGQQDMYVGTHSFRLKTDLPGATELSLDRAKSEDDNQYINTYLAQLTIDGTPVAGKTIEFRIKHVWLPNGRPDTTPMRDVSNVRTAVTDDKGVATFRLPQFDLIRDIHDQYFIQANFRPRPGDKLSACLSPSFTMATMTPRRNTPYTYPLYLAENTMFVSAPTAERYPELLELVDRIKSFSEDATIDEWADAIGSEGRAREIVDFLVANHVLSKTNENNYHWYRSIHCGAKVIENVRLDDVPDYIN